MGWPSPMEDGQSTASYRDRNSLRPQEPKKHQPFIEFMLGLPWGFLGFWPLTRKVDQLGFTNWDLDTYGLTFTNHSNNSEPAPCCACSICGLSIVRMSWASRGPGTGWTFVSQLDPMIIYDCYSQWSSYTMVAVYKNLWQMQMCVYFIVLHSTGIHHVTCRPGLTTCKPPLSIIGLMVSTHPKIVVNRVIISGNGE